jgi:4'-phosphopantetheinyl transferase EntD
VIEEILPAEVKAVEAYQDVHDAPLFAEEEAVVARAVDKRRREFTTARFCARAALARLGVPPVPILTGLRGAPTWPAGIVGSITHCAGYRACAVARACEVATIGLDAEPNEPLPNGVLDAVSVAEERSWLRALAAAAPGVCWDRLLFSAKEAVYKAWFPLTQRWLDFDQAVVTVDPVEMSFAARLLVPGPTVAGRQLSTLDGRWLSRNGLVVATIVVPANQSGFSRGQASPAWPPTPRA